MNDTILNLLLVYVVITLFLALMVIREQQSILALTLAHVERMHQKITNYYSTGVRRPGHQQKGGNYGHGQNLN
jgi:hypothetical protein